MAEYPQNFPPIKSPLVSIGLNDFASGTGYVNFHGKRLALHSDPQATDTYILDTAGAVSNTGVLGLGISNDYDFDTSVFTVARRIQGDIYLTTGFSTDNGTDTLTTLVFTIYKVASNGTTETQISQASYANVSSTGTILSIRFDDCDQLIGVGEKLRLNVTSTAASGQNGWIGINERGDWTGAYGDPTFYDLLLCVPFKTDL